MIQKKKDDHSYRVFRKVNRKAQSFPMAEDFSFSNIPRDIAVWCSNDYLGMSRHPSVVDAAKYVFYTWMTLLPLFASSFFHGVHAWRRMGRNQADVNKTNILKEEIFAIDQFL